MLASKSRGGLENSDGLGALQFVHIGLELLQICCRCLHIVVDVPEEEGDEEGEEGEDPQGAKGIIDQGIRGKPVNGREKRDHPSNMQEDLCTNGKRERMGMRGVNGA